jgi:tetratricopeptide (TPR) repeat protein
MSRVKTVVLGLMVLVLIAGVTVLAYAHWTKPISDADAQVAAGQLDSALANYASAETRFDHFPAAKQAFASEYNRVVANQLWLLYRLGRYDAVIDKAERAPEGADPHFWAGCALYQKSQAALKPQEKKQILSSAQQELHDALANSPEDWDAKYDFEMVARLQKGPSQKQGGQPQNIDLLRKEPSEYKNKQVKPEG